jgi:hypothetical protein
MNKLTEIKERHNGIKFMSHTRTHKDALQYEDDVTYLISLLEEKDKALAFYADENNYEQQKELYDENNPLDFYFEEPLVLNGKGDIARKALNTSSNNEGEV